MSFTDEVTNNTSSERFMLFRVTPGRLLTPNKTQIGAIINGKIFEAPFPFPSYSLQKFLLSGVEFTRVSGTPTGLSEWSLVSGNIQWVEPNNPVGFDWQAVVFYNLYYSSGLSVITNATPGDTGTPEVIWEPRITIEPSATQDSSKLISGFLSTAISQVTIANHDTDFQQYLTDVDSFNQKDASVWLVANGPSNFQKVYSGKVRQIVVTKNSISMQLFDVLSLLDQPSLMGDSVTQAYLTQDFIKAFQSISGQPNRIRSEDSGRAIPFFLGPSSAFISQDYELVIDITTSNRFIDFTDDAGSFSAAVNIGTYTKSQLQLSLPTILEGATTDPNAAFTVDYDRTTNKWTITNDNVLNTTFSLDWNTGPNSANTLGVDLGYDTSSDDTGSNSYTSDDAGPWTEADTVTEMTPAVCTSYNPPLRSDSRNRVWTIGRVQSSGIKTLDLDAVSSVNASAFPLLDFDGNAANQVYWVTGANNNMEIGDTFKVTNGGDVSYHRVIWRGDTGETFSYNGTSYDTVTVYDGVHSGFGTVSELEAVTVVVKDENNKYWYPLKDRDYQIFTKALDSGNFLVQIRFETAFRSNVGKPDSVSPDFDTVYMRVGSASNTNHADALKLLAETAGIDVSTTSFTTAKSALAADVQFSMPELDKLDRDFESYRFYAELIAKSTLSLMYINTDFELAYQLIATPSGGNTVTDSNYANLNISIDYNDILTELDAFNLHNDSEWARRRTDTPGELRTSAAARYLHQINTSTRYRHVLRTITDRIDDLFNVLKERRLLYQYDSSPRDLAANVGDSVVLESDDIAGGDATKPARIVGITKNANRVTVKISDLLGL